MGSSQTLGGGYDYLLQVVTRDIDSYQRLIRCDVESRIGLSQYSTYVVTKPIKTGHGPPLDLLCFQSFWQE
jgi:Lrp/AsnC family transcriptional regulator of ectoine degradation